MSKWEYKLIEFKASGFIGGLIDLKAIQHELNKLGKKGWELTAAYTTNGTGSTRKVVYNLKRALEL
jgi:GTP-sensing pleiotropic transcriptional regulator CodY